jgi:UDP-N-acetyl-D-glucosamine 4,6-dehydratase
VISFDTAKHLLVGIEYNISLDKGASLSMHIDGRILNIFIIILLTYITFRWSFWVFHQPFELDVVLSVMVARVLSSLLLFKDFSLSWSKVSPKTFLTKSTLYSIAFLLYMPFFYNKIPIYFMLSELFFYLFAINFMMYAYYYLINKKAIKKSSNVVVYGAGSAGVKLKRDLEVGRFRILYFVDDDKELQKRTIDSIDILSQEQLIKKLSSKKIHIDLLIIAMPSIDHEIKRKIYNNLLPHIKEIKTLPPLEEILHQKPFSSQIKDISLTELLARHPKDLDKAKIASFIQGQKVLITGAGGSIGSEIVRQALLYGAKELILLDHSEYNLYTIEQEIGACTIPIHFLLHSVVNKALLDESFLRYSPDIVIHAAAYKHVPMVEANIKESIINNIIGTKQTIDSAIKHGAKHFILISTDKAVRPTNVMGATKRICELYAQNVDAQSTNIVSVRFGNVLGSSGSVIPKFKEQIAKNQNLTVTHPEITRYFMLIPEACELVLQAGAIGKGGELFILDMGEPVKIVDLAQKMIDLSGKEGIKIEFTALREGEKLYEELLIDEENIDTEYDSIMITQPTLYPIDQLNRDIEQLLKSDHPLQQLQKIVPEFDHQRNL